MATNQASIRIHPALEAAVREHNPELANADLSTLIRAGLGVLAGMSLVEALSASWTQHRGRKPRADAAVNSP